MTPKEINALITQRRGFLKTDRKKADAIEKKIKKIFLKNYMGYTVEFIIETLTMFGQAPCLVYDDNGKFAVSSTGMQPVVHGTVKFANYVTTILTKNQWKRTIREALLHYLKS